MDTNNGGVREKHLPSREDLNNVLLGANTRKEIAPEAEFEFT